MRRDLKVMSKMPAQPEAITFTLAQPPMAQPPMALPPWPVGLKAPAQPAIARPIAFPMALPFNGDAAGNQQRLRAPAHLLKNSALSVQDQEQVLDAPSNDDFWAKFEKQNHQDQPEPAGAVQVEPIFWIATPGQPKKRARIDVTQDAFERAQCMADPADDEQSSGASSSPNDLLPRTNMISMRKNVTERQTYAGLKTIPPGSYDRFKVLNPAENRLQTYFVCKFRNCNKVFQKSTSLIVHYWRHNDVRPFTCNLCNKSFTQSGTLSRHNRAVHKIKSTVSLTWQQVRAAEEARQAAEQICQAAEQPSGAQEKAEE